MNDLAINRHNLEFNLRKEGESVFFGLKMRNWNVVSEIDRKEFESMSADTAEKLYDRLYAKLIGDVYIIALAKYKG